MKQYFLSKKIGLICMSLMAAMFFSCGNDEEVQPSNEAWFKISGQVNDTIQANDVVGTVRKLTEKLEVLTMTINTNNYQFNLTIKSSDNFISRNYEVQSTNYQKSSVSLSNIPTGKLYLSQRGDVILERFNQVAQGKANMVLADSKGEEVKLEGRFRVPVVR
ncbi:MAG: hypothetical protein ACNS62_08545 [Candidatus Cyclobacteriaceae bacterium M3_2C_046]